MLIAKDLKNTFGYNHSKKGIPFWTFSTAQFDLISDYISQASQEYSTFERTRHEYFTYEGLEGSHKRKQSNTGRKY